MRGWIWDTWFLFPMEEDRVERRKGMDGGEVEEGGGERVKFSADHLWLVYKRPFILSFGSWCCVMHLLTHPLLIDFRKAEISRNCVDI